MRAWKAEFVFLCIALVMGPVLVFLTPPFQVPDEIGHFLRAYQVADGQWLSIQADGRLGGWLPASLTDTASLYSDIPYHPEKRVPAGAWSRAWRVPLNPASTRFADFAGQGLMQPVAYLPQVAGMLPGKLLCWPPLGLLYAGRLANLCFWIGLTFLAIRLLPHGQWLLATLALAPMAIFQAASLSYDALAMGTGFVLIAMTLRLAAAGTPVSWRDTIRLTAVALLLSLTKPFYAAAALLAFLPTPAGRSLRAQAWKYAACFGVLGAGTVMAWSLSAGNFISYDDYHPAYRESQCLMPGANPAEQLQVLLQHPLRLVNLLFTAAIHLPTWSSWVGNLGWLDTPFPRWFYLGFAGAILALTLLDGPESRTLQAWQRVILLATAGLMFVLNGVALYLQWCPVGHPFIIGVHGRHLIPLMPLVVLALQPNRRCGASALLPCLLPWFWIGIQLLTVYTLVLRYYIAG